ncbi:Vps54-domain-containing protein [Hysterangium stoloniferum]|nr:Vps54-domain-containing protein [Hysterangium stoloniferum]
MEDAVTEAPTSRPGSPDRPVPPLPETRQPVYRFNWDPSLRRPGPGSVSEATERRDDTYGSPAAAAAFHLNNFSSLSLALPHEWSSSKHGFNAISTVMNNPHKRQAPPKAHSSLPAVPPVILPRVKRKDFEPYLDAIRPEWERFERSVRMGREGAAQLDPGHEPPSNHPSAPGLSADTGPFTPRTPRTPLPSPGKAPPPLAVVPPVYFESNFDMGDPRTFALVTEALEGEHGDGIDPAAIAHSLPLLEKLSHYADVVEQHLVREISLRSSSFFAALTNLHELQTESQVCLDRVGRLRAMLKEVDERTAKRGLEMVRLESRLANMDKVSEGVKVVTDVTEMVVVSGNLVQAGEWDEALGVIEELGSLWEPGPPPPKKDDDGQLQASDAATHATRPIIPLSALQAFASLPSHLQDLTLQIANSLTAELVAVVKSDLLMRIEGHHEMEKTNGLLRDQLKPLLQGLVRTKGVRAALGGWRDLVMAEIRAAVKRDLPSLSDVDEEDAGSSKKTLSERSLALAKELREMSHEAYLKLSHSICTSLMRCLQGVQAQSQAISVLLADTVYAEDSPPNTAAFESDLSDTLTSACELANARVSKVLSVRAEQHSQLQLSEFHAVFELTWQFVLACEVLCRKMIVGLRGTAVSQAKAFLSAFHASRITMSAKLVEDEQWAQVEVSGDMQRLVGLLVDAAMRDPVELVLPRTELQILPPSSVSASSNGQVRQPLSPPSTPPISASSQLYIEDRPYFIVSATLQVLVVLLTDYVKLIVNLPLLTTDAMSRIIEFLKAFNSRTCQVVLGAGAMRSAGLKNITARHLALASQSLSIAVALIPYVRETFRRHLSATQAVMLVEFDKLKRDYQEHQHEIHAKLVVIMGDRLNVHCRSLQEIKWDVASSDPGPSGYMETLVKETATLDKVLSKYLAAPAVELVMTQVLAAINHRLSEEFGKIELGTHDAKDRLLRDVRYLHEKMSGLKHVGAPTGMLETIVQEKAVAGASRKGQSPSQSRLSAKLAAVVGNSSTSTAMTSSASASELGASQASGSDDV